MGRSVISVVENGSPSCEKAGRITVSLLLQGNR